MSVDGDYLDPTPTVKKKNSGTDLIREVIWGSFHQSSAGVMERRS